MPIVFSFTDNYTVPAYIAIASLLDCAEANTKYDVIILHLDITPKHIKNFQKLFLHTRHRVKFQKVGSDMLKNYPKSTRWPEIVYIRLFMDELLSDYDKVIYSDVDVLFKGDLASLYQTDMTDFEWAGVRAERNNSHMTGHRYFQNNTNQYIYMSGFMLCNLAKMREEQFSDIVRNNINKYGSELLMFDLDILNMSSSKIKDVPIRYAYLMDYYESKDIRKAPQYKYMRTIYPYQTFVEEKRNVVIIHYSGALKHPWKRFLPPKEYRHYIKKMPFVLKMEYIKNRCKVEVS